MAHPYACAECGAPVSVRGDGHVTRSCSHDGATIVAERSAGLTGEGGAAEQSLAARAHAAILALARVLVPGR